MISCQYFFILQILNEIAQHKIKIYEFPECDDEEENKIQKKLRVSFEFYIYVHVVSGNIKI
jgi:septin 7